LGEKKPDSIHGLSLNEIQFALCGRGRFLLLFCINVLQINVFSSGSLDIQAHTIQLQVGLFVFCPIASAARSFFGCHEN
jgi:hypothetical protein